MLNHAISDMLAEIRLLTNSPVMDIHGTSDLARLQMAEIAVHATFLARSTLYATSIPRLKNGVRWMRLAFFVLCSGVKASPLCMGVRMGAELESGMGV